MPSVFHGKQDVCENGPQAKTIGTMLCYSWELKMHAQKMTAE